MTTRWCGVLRVCPCLQTMQTLMDQCQLLWADTTSPKLALALKLMLDALTQADAACVVDHNCFALCLRLVCVMHSSCRVRFRAVAGGDVQAPDERRQTLCAGLTSQVARLVHRGSSWLRDGEPRELDTCRDTLSDVVLLLLDAWADGCFTDSSVAATRYGYYVSHLVRYLAAAVGPAGSVAPTADFDAKLHVLWREMQEHPPQLGVLLPQRLQDAAPLGDEPLDEPIVVTRVPTRPLWPILLAMGVSFEHGSTKCLSCNPVCSPDGACDLQCHACARSHSRGY